MVDFPGDDDPDEDEDILGVMSHLRETQYDT